MRSKHLATDDACGTYRSTFLTRTVPGVIVTAVLSVMLSGCHRPEEPEVESPVTATSGTNETTDSFTPAEMTETYSYADREAAVERMNGQLTRINQELAELRTEIETLGDEGREVWSAKMAHAEQLRDQLELQIHELEVVGKDQWASALSTAKDSFRRAAAKVEDLASDLPGV